MRIKGLPIVRSGLALPSGYKRADDDTEGVEATEGTLGRLFVRFSPFNTPYEINSFWEGRFIERTLPGAFKKTISESKRGDGTFSTKVLFNHGSDLHIGDKPLAVADTLAEVNSDGYHGPELEGDLLNTSYNRDLNELLRANALGSSFMFEVIQERWNNEPGESETNPEGLPERDISEVRLFEAGPVTWPASPTASAGMRSKLVGRSGTDSWMERLATRNGRRYEDLVRSYEASRSLYKVPDYKPGTPTPEVVPDTGRQVDEAARREATIRAHRLELMKAGY
jgi:phage head maturation protease